MLPMSTLQAFCDNLFRKKVYEDTDVKFSNTQPVSLEFASSKVAGRVC